MLPQALTKLEVPGGHLLSVGPGFDYSFLLSVRNSSAFYT